MLVSKKSIALLLFFSITVLSFSIILGCKPHNINAESNNVGEQDNTQEIKDVECNLCYVDSKWLYYQSSTLSSATNLGYIDCEGDNVFFYNGNIYSVEKITESDMDRYVLCQYDLTYNRTEVCILADYGKDYTRVVDADGSFYIKDNYFYYVIGRFLPEEIEDYVSEFSFCRCDLNNFFTTEELGSFRGQSDGFQFAISGNDEEVVFVQSHRGKLYVESIYQNPQYVNIFSYSLNDKSFKEIYTYEGEVNDNLFGEDVGIFDLYKNSFYLGSDNCIYFVPSARDRHTVKRKLVKFNITDNSSTVVCYYDGFVGNMYAVDDMIYVTCISREKSQVDNSETFIKKIVAYNIKTDTAETVLNLENANNIFVYDNDSRVVFAKDGNIVVK